MSSNVSLADLAGEVERLEKALTNEVEAAHRSSKATLTIAFALAVVVLGFIGFTYVKLSSEWTREKFAQSLGREMAELKPHALREVSILGQGLLPVYAEEGKKQLAEMGPEIAERCQEELDKLSGDLLVAVHQRLRQAENRILAETENALFQSYPGLKDKVQVEEMRKAFHARIETTMANALTDFETRFRPHVEALQKTILEFDVTDNGLDEVELQKRLIHNWLQLLDQEIMSL
jgi:hypothetical protein